MAKESDECYPSHPKSEIEKKEATNPAGTEVTCVPRRKSLPV